MVATNLHDTTIPRPIRPTSAKLFVSPLPRVAVELAGITHPGKVRSNNEDNYAVIRRSRRQDLLLTSQSAASFVPETDEAYLFLMADGMGGAAFGELASSLAIRNMWLLGEQCTNWVMKITEFDPQLFKVRVEAYVERLQQAFRDSVSARPQAAGMGTTLTAVYTMGFDTLVAQLGDSRAYLCRQETLRRLTRDHTVAEQFQSMGMESELANSFRHILTSCLGGDTKSARADVDYVRLQPGDVLLLATDGLTDVVSDDRLAQRIHEASNIRALCQTLVDDALDGGGPDNITIVAARFSEANDD